MSSGNFRGAANTKTRSLLGTPTTLAWLLASAADDSTAKASAVDDIGAVFDKLDSDHSAGIDRAEAEKLPGLSEVFSKYDQDNDGTLDPDEFAKAITAITSK